MLSPRAVRAAARIPWIRENLPALRTLNDTFYLLIALFSSRRYHDFHSVLGTFFEMVHSFAQYGRSEAKDTVDRLLEIPWFGERRRAMLRLISAYNRVVERSGLKDVSSRGTGPTLRRARAAIEDFVQSIKELADFDHRDENRIQSFMEDPEALGSLTEEILDLMVPEGLDSQIQPEPWLLSRNLEPAHRYGESTMVGAPYPPLRAESDNPRRNRERYLSHWHRSP